PEALQEVLNALAFADPYEDLAHVKRGLWGRIAWIEMYRGNLDTSWNIYQWLNGYHYLARISFERNNPQLGQQLIRLQSVKR
ncbi:MAG: hypothetical protein ABEL51_02580, partial [Salinibacter sp.]